ncbi:MAG: ABC1 kinase family protein [Planctomycetota bacterium]|jgi:ubiquinone biosynthesis protein
MPRLKLRLDRTIEHLRRHQHIMAVMTKYGFGEVVASLRQKLPHRLRGPEPVGGAAPSDGRSRPHRVRMALEELGPTFVKLGQLLSTRPDLVGPDYVEEFERLQDCVPPERFKRVEAELAEQLGGSVDERFGKFDRRCVAAGSIAQVHHAVTLDGEEVAVKVRRPGIIDAIQTECEILEGLAGVIKATLSDKETVDPVRIVQEFSEAVNREVHLDIERRNVEMFRRHFADDPAVHIVKLYDDYCTDGVLTMEFIRGVKPTSLAAVEEAGLDAKLLAGRLADFILRQIFDCGLFHTDPHPGNLFILPGNVLVPIDFGQVACLTAEDRLVLGELVLTVVERDASGLVETFEDGEMLHEQTDVHTLTRDIEETFSVYHSLPLGEIPLTEVLNRIFHLIRRHRVKLPAEFALMMKSMTIVESLAGSLDEDFRLVEHLRPYARRLSAEQLDPRRFFNQARRAVKEAGLLATKLPGDLIAVLEKLKRGRLQLHVQHEHLESMVKTVDKSSNRVSFAMIIAGLLVASSMLITQEGTVLGLSSFQAVGMLGYLVAAVLGLWLIISIMRSRHL